MTGVVQTNLKGYLKDLLERSGKSDTTVQDTALTRLQEIGLPNRKSEMWKYVDLNALYKQPYQDDTTPLTMGGISIKSSVQSDTLCLKNGLIKSVPTMDGVKVCSKEIGSDDLAPLKQETDPFYLLNVIQQTQMIEITISKTSHTPLQISLEGDKEHTNLATTYLKLQLEKGVSATVIIKREGDTSVLTNSHLQAGLLEDAQLTVINSSDPNCLTIMSQQFECQARAKLKLINVDNQSQFNRQKIEVKLVGKEAHADLYGASLSGQTQAHYTHINVYHDVPDCTSTQLFKNLLFEKSVTEFTGMVHVAKKAHGTESDQSNPNMVLSDHAHAYSRPQLRILADDVQCNHGSTVSQHDPERIFYFKARGLSEQNAYQVLTYGFLKEILEQVEVEGLRDQLEAQLSSALKALLPTWSP